jgi:hypothetical protein
MCSLVFPWSPENFANSGILVPFGYAGDGQTGYHKVSDMTAPGDYTNSELISERPSYFLSYYIDGNRWEITSSLVQYG